MAHFRFARVRVRARARAWKFVAPAVALALVFAGANPPKLRAAADTGCDRARVVAAWRFGGPQVRASAETTLLGSDADVCTFLSTTWAARQKVDERVEVNQMMAAGGVTLQAAAQQALDSTDGNALPTFLSSGWVTPADTDLRVRVNQMMAAGGSVLRVAAQKALDAGNPDALRTFVQTGWRQPWQTDQRVRINQIMAAGGPEVKAAAQRALDAGTVDAFADFLHNGWELAAARDQETETVADLVNAASDASAQAAQQTQAAKDAAAVAKSEAEAARQAAQDAADASTRAQGDAQAAAAAAAQAADAATKAAAAAAEAVSAANAANAAARVAAGAAARAARAAAEAGSAAAQARDAAAKAAQDQQWVAQARSAAQHARDIAVATNNAALAANQAGIAGQEASAAVVLAAAAASQVSAAADAAERAATQAGASGADAAAAHAAATKARAAANRANQAAQAASSFAATAATAAFAARDAATRAVADANAAAAAADSAADHAGHAVDAAKEATDDANAATASAQAAVDLVQQAQAVYDAARQADATRIATEGDQADQDALDANAAAQGVQAQAKWDATEAAKRSAETNRLIAEANDPATARELAVADARKVALALAVADGPWTQAAARNALGSGDDDVLEFVHTGVGIAAGQDDRTVLQSIADTATPAFAQGAQAALAGSDADVAAFLASRDYTGKETDDRTAVNQVMAAARDAGDQVTMQRAQQALDDGSDQALRDFLSAGQYVAATVDERVKINQIIANSGSGPELKTAAQAALDGPPGYAHQFLTVGQYVAAQRDQDSAAHDAVVSGLLAEGYHSAAIATQNALDAQSSAASARNDAAAAVAYANQAAASAQQALGYAQQAKDSATAATASANSAAASAQRAAAAAQSANAAANQAAASARWAQSSAYQAYGYAATAMDAYNQAKASAIAAGKDAADAIEAANQAYAGAVKTARDELEAQSCGEFAMNPPLHDQCKAKVDDFLDHRNDYMTSNGEVCGYVWVPGTDEHKDCLYHAAGDPLFDWNLQLDVVNKLATSLANFVDMIAPYVCNIVPGWGAVACGLAFTIINIAQDPKAFWDNLKDPQFWLKNAPNMVLNMLFAKSMGQGLLRAGGQTADAAATWGGAALAEQTDLQVAAEEAALARFASDQPDFEDFLPGLEREAEKDSEFDGAVACDISANSFTADTRVLLAGGGSKPIADVRVGDVVRAGDPGTGQVRPEPVTGVISHAGPHTMVAVTLAGGGVLHATDHHPFWDSTQGAFVDAVNLRVGDELRNADGQAVRIQALGVSQADLTAYNLTVADLHTFYVTGNGPAILVHNGVPCPVEGLSAAGKTRYQLLVDTLAKVRNLPISQLKALLKPGELQAGIKEPWLRRLFMGSALERGVADDPAVRGDGSIVHLGTEMPGQRVADFQIKDGDNLVNIDVTGASASSISKHLSRDYIDSLKQIIPYLSFTDDELRQIFQ